MEIYIIHHTHTDRGYTHLKSYVKCMHLDYIDEAVKYASEDEDFRWTCEASEAVWNYLTCTRPREAVDLFLEAVKRGQIDVAPFFGHLTFYPDYDTLRTVLDCARDLKREFGVNPAPAMSVDVNGTQWANVDLLLEIGCPGIITAINVWRGGIPLPRLTLFYWKGPSDKKIPVWLGEHYHLLNIFGVDNPQKVGGPDKVAEKIKHYVQEVGEGGYDKESLILQVSGLYYDNSPPSRRLAQNVRTLNGILDESGIRLRLATATEGLREVMRSWNGALPTYRGDWPDWWSQRFEGTPTILANRAASLLRRKKVLYEYKMKASCPKESLRKADTLEREARNFLLEYCEHTHNIVGLPWRLESTAATHYSDSTASYAHQLAEESLAMLGTFSRLRSPMQDSVIWVFNTLPFECQTIVRAHLDSPLAIPEKATVWAQDKATKQRYAVQSEKEPRGQSLNFLATLPPREPHAFSLEWSLGLEDADKNGLEMEQEGFYKDWIDKEAHYPLSCLIAEEVKNAKVEVHDPQARGLVFNLDTISIKRHFEQPRTAPKEAPKDTIGMVYRRKVRYVSLAGCQSAWVTMTEFFNLEWLGIEISMLPGSDESSYMYFVSIPLNGNLSDLNLLRPSGYINYSKDILPGACRSYLLHSGGSYVMRSKDQFSCVSTFDYPLVYPGCITIGNYGSPPKEQSENAHLYFNILNHNAQFASHRGWVTGSLFLAGGKGGSKVAERTLQVLMDPPLVVVGDENCPW